MLSLKRTRIPTSCVAAPVAEANVHVLIVDDSKFMRRTIVRALNEIGDYTFAEASNGAEGLSRLNEHKFDLVMTDWNMPVMNGLEFVTNLRRVHTVPVLMVTTVSNREEVMDALQAGVNNYILKPLSAVTLAHKIDEIFSKI